MGTDTVNSVIGVIDDYVPEESFGFKLPTTDETKALWIFKKVEHVNLTCKVQRKS